jgi:hypothetical protein
MIWVVVRYALYLLSAVVAIVVYVAVFTLIGASIAEVLDLLLREVGLGTELHRR